MRFADPWWFVAFAALPIKWWFERRRPKPSIVYSDLSLLLAPTAKSFRLRTRWLPTVFWTLGVACIVAALARPQVPDESQSTRARGRGVSLVVDVSGSMGKTMSVSEGVKTTRLNKVKQIIESLIATVDSTHPADEFGLTVFAAEPRTASPATTERPFVRRKLAAVEIDARDNRTEIGAGIALGVDLVRDRSEGEAALVLFTDGAQRVEEGIGPFAGARIAEAFGAPIVVVHFADDPEESADLKTLERIAEITHGVVIHWPEATPEKILSALPPPLETKSAVVVWRDAFRAWIVAAIVLLAAASILQATLYRMALIDVND